MVNDDFYAVLELQRDASAIDIRRAYRSNAMKYHPDKNPENENEAEEQFIKVRKAYETLSDPYSRERYDKFGKDANESTKEVNPDNLYESLFGGKSKNVSDNSFFESLFGFTETRKTESIQFEMKVGLTDLYTGVVKHLKINRKIVCPGCKGVGSSDQSQIVKCVRCKGTKIQITVQQSFGFLQQSYSNCPDCGGHGEYILQKNRCGTCFGEKVVNESCLLKFQIEAGMEDGDVLVLEGESDRHPSMQPGDIVIIIRELSDYEQPFKRAGANLILNHTLSLVEALTGFIIRVNALDGRLLNITGDDDQIVRPGDIRIIENEGMPVRQSKKKRRFVYKFGCGIPHLFKFGN